MTDVRTHPAPRLCAWLAEVTLDDIPAHVRREATLRIIDSVGVALAARDEPGVRHLLELVPDVPHPDGVPIMGHARSTDVRSAALVNGTMTHALDFDDTVLPTRLHAAGSLTAGLLALGHLWDVTGEQLLLGFVAGFEVAVRLADALHPGAYNTGWQNTGVLSPAAVAAGGSVFYGADPRTIEHALGVALSQGAGVLANKGSMTKSLHAGRGAEGGVLSAIVARNGFTARPGVLADVPGAFLRMFGGEPTPVDTETLGEQWSVLRSGVKPYACGFVAHAAIDAALALRTEADIAAHRVASLQLDVRAETLELMGDSSPGGGLEAKFSLPFVVAAALVYGHVGASVFDGDEAVADPAVQRLMRATTVDVDDSLTQDQARLSLRTVSGEERSVFVKAALGTMDNPMGEEAVLAKFRQLVPRDGGGRGEALEAALRALADQTSVREVTRCM